MVYILKRKNAKLFGFCNKKGNEKKWIAKKSEEIKKVP